MPPNAHQTALRSITEARRLLRQVVTSSESFDYRRAKEALKELDGLIRELGREEARLRGHGDKVEGGKLVPFPIGREAS